MNTNLMPAEHRHLLNMIETMQRAGYSEHAIESSVRRATRGRPPEPDPMPRRGMLAALRVRNAHV